MAGSQKANKRIAKNTLFLYIRMLFTMCVSLFTSRILIAALGITDYGVYNAVGGMVGLSYIIAGSMTVAISRFITVWVGKNDRNKLRVVFSTSMIILLIMAAIVILFAEFIGIWFLDHKMVIPSDRMTAAHWVLQCAIFSFIIKLLSVPYNAIIVAYERMSAFAYMTIMEVSLKLVIVYMILYTNLDKLILYAILMSLLALLVRFIYADYCHKNYRESHFCFILDHGLIKDMMCFIGWAFWGNGVVILRNQGTTVLLNIFCGPAVNAARGIAMQVNNSVYGFVSNFLTAVKPQITKSYSSGNLKDTQRLIVQSSKFAYFILFLLLLPVCANVDYILNLWLVEVPNHTSAFVQLILLYSLVECFYQPLLVGILANGDIKKYEIGLTVLYTINFGLSYMMLQAGFPPESCFVANIIFDIFVVITLLIQAKEKLSLSISYFIMKSLTRVLVISVLCLVFILIVPVTGARSLIGFIIDTIIILLFTGSAICAVGINSNERYYLVKIIKSKVCHVYN